MGSIVAVLTNQQMKVALYAGGAAIALIWFRAQANGNSLTKQAAQDTVNTVVEVTKGLGDAVGVEVLKPVSEVAAVAASKPFKAIYTGMETEFLMNVQALGGIKLVTVGEKKLALEYMNTAAQAVDGLPVLGLWSAINAYRAASAVIEYRNNSGLYQPWGIQ